MATLVGLFSKQATDKLQEVFTTLFKTDQKAARNDPLSNPAPTLAEIVPREAAHGTSKLRVKLSGSNFIAASVVRVDGVDRKPVVQTPETLEIDLTTADLATPKAISLLVYNPPPGGGTSDAAKLTVAQ